ncbi:MAG: GNAT family N-acetyltransferase [Chloroflexi bacterium]|nr:GNAT family N-acetyltransferase [Chloroflexota bacterium]
MFRRLQPYDLLALRPGLANEAQPLERCLNRAPGWGGTFASLAGTWLPLGRHRQAWVVAPRGRLAGLVSVRPRSGPLAWEIERLTAVEPEGVGSELLEHLVMAAAGAGADRIFLRLPVDSAWCEVAQRVGFASYMQEQLYLGSLPSWVVPPALPLRPRQALDDLGLFRLYCLVAPTTVRQFVGITLQEWQQSREPLPFRRGQEMVTEEDGTLTGWLRLTAWSQARDFAVMAHPHKGDLAGMARHALAGCPPRSSLSCLVPDYQEGLGRLLEEYGFVGTARYASLVRMVAVRSNHPCLLPAHA